MKKVIESKIKERGGTRLYRTSADRERAITLLRWIHGRNYFVRFRDASGMYGLQYGTVDWLPIGHVWFG